MLSSVLNNPRAVQMNIVVYQDHGVILPAGALPASLDLPTSVMRTSAPSWKAVAETMQSRRR